MKISSPADLLREPEPKPSDETVPTIRFDAPKLTTADIVKAAETGKGVWRSLDILHRESVEERRAKVLRAEVRNDAYPRARWFLGRGGFMKPQFRSLNWRDNSTVWPHHEMWREWMAAAEVNRNHKFSALERSLSQCKNACTEIASASSPK